MKRRTLLSRAAALALLACWPLSPALAHTPYRQWDIFRRRYLQILTSRGDLDGDAVGDAWVAALLERLPLSRAMISRARDTERVASLLKTNQAKLAVLSHADAKAMTDASGPFAEYVPMPLQLLVDDGRYLLVARENLPLHHAYAVTAALIEAGGKLRLSVPLEGRYGLPVHAGARAAALGERIDVPAPADGV
jgi:hypothetical protein